MASDPSDWPREPDHDDFAFRQLAAGSIRHVMLDDGDRVTVGSSPEVFVQIAGRGRLLWPGATNDDRNSSTLFVPPRAHLAVKGKVRALRVLLLDLRTMLVPGPVSEILVGLLCSRAWHGSAPVADAALNVVHRLLEDEARAKAAQKPNGQG